MNLCIRFTRFRSTTEALVLKLNLLVVNWTTFNQNLTNLLAERKGKLKQTICYSLGVNVQRGKRLPVASRSYAFIDRHQKFGPNRFGVGWILQEKTHTRRMCNSQTMDDAFWAHVCTWLCRMESRKPALWICLQEESTISIWLWWLLDWYRSTAHRSSTLSWPKIEEK